MLARFGHFVPEAFAGTAGAGVEGAALDVSPFEEEELEEDGESAVEPEESVFAGSLFVSAFPASFLAASPSFFAEPLA